MSEPNRPAPTESDRDDQIMHESGTTAETSGGGLFGSEEGGVFAHARRYLTANAISGLLGIVSVAVLARLMAPADYGQWIVFLSLVPFVVLAPELNLRAALKREALEQDADVPGCLRTLLAFILCTSVVLIVLGSVAFPWLVETLSLSRLATALLLLAAIIQIPWVLYSELLVARQESARLSKLRVVRDAIVLTCATSGALLLAGIDPIGQSGGAMLGWSLAAASLSIVFAGRLAREARYGTVRFAHLRHALTYALPLLLLSIAQLVLHSFDRLIVHQIDGAGPAANYAVGYMVGGLIAVFALALTQAWVPVFINHAERREHKAIQQTVGAQSLDVAGAALLVSILAPELIAILAGSNWSVAPTIVPCVAFGYAGLFASNVYGNYALWLKRTSWPMAAALIAAAVNIAANYALVPRYGYIASGWTTLGCFWLMAVLNYACARFVFQKTVGPLWLMTRWNLALGAAALGYAMLVDDGSILKLCVKLALIALAIGILAREALAARWHRISGS